MYPRLRMKQQQPFANNSRRITTPVLGFLLGKCYAAPITRSFLPIYLCVSHTVALLMASNTSYLNANRDASAFHTVFIRCLSPVNVLLSLCSISGARAAPCSVVD
jgi:hypothetical protein